MPGLSCNSRHGNSHVLVLKHKRRLSHVGTLQLETSGASAQDHRGTRWHGACILYGSAHEAPPSNWFAIIHEIAKNNGNHARKDAGKVTGRRGFVRGRYDVWRAPSRRIRETANPRQSRANEGFNPGICGLEIHDSRSVEPPAILRALQAIQHSDLPTQGTASTNRNGKGSECRICQQNPLAVVL